MTIRIFEINDCEWWAGDCTPAEILKTYMEYMNCSHEDATGDIEDLPIPISDASMDKLKFVHDEDGELLATPLTFREYLALLISKGTTFPCFFATTEW